jgi:CheY-like chemotaxis protein
MAVDRLERLMMDPEWQDILVVDQDPVRRALIERILTEDGFEVTAVSEGLAALRAAGSGRFALIVAAIGLPGTLDGAATVRQVRARQPWVRALFIDHPAGLSRRDYPDCDDVIGAPFQRRELLGCVFELLHRDVLPDAADLGRRCRAEFYAR